MKLSLLCLASAATVAAASPLRGYLAEVSPKGICDPNVEQYSGYFKLTTGDKNYFYWSFESRSVSVIFAV